MILQSNSLRKYGLSLALLLLIVLAAVLSLSALSTQHTSAHADGISVEDGFILNVDLRKSGNGRVFLLNSYDPHAEIQISVDDHVSATFLAGTPSGFIDVQPGTHTIIGRYSVSDGQVIQSVPTLIEVNDKGEIVSSNYSY